MGAFVRFFISMPIALIVTILLFLGLYNQLSSRPFLYTSPDEPGQVILAFDYEEPVILCDCGWFWLPEEPDTNNSWTESEKAVNEPPQPVSEPTDFPESIQAPYVGDSYHNDRSLTDHFVSPVYPKKCIKLGIETARVVVEFDIDREGRVVKPRIIESTHECFNQSVLKAISKWKYKPHLSGGKPVERKSVREIFTFTLSGDNT